MRFLAAFLRSAGSLTAGFLIGLAVVASVFAMTVADAGAWQAVWMLGAAATFALGLALQVVVTLKPRQLRTTAPGPGAMPRRFTGLSHQH